MNNKIFFKKLKQKRNFSSLSLNYDWVSPTPSRCFGELHTLTLFQRIALFSSSRT
jgi:hypothetical protein